MDPAEDQVRPDRDLEPVRLERDALLLVAARTGGHDRKQVAPLDRQAVERDPMSVRQALALEVVDAEPLLAVEEVGQPFTEHGHLARDRAVAGETHEVDRLHGRGHT